MMKYIAIALPFAMMLAGCGQEASEDTASKIEKSVTASKPEQRPDCADVEFEKAEFTHCIANPDTHHINMRLYGEDKEPLRSLTALALEPDAGNIAFAVNGGMYDENGEPIGYYVESGARLHDINKDDGKGNFYLKPNGIFFGSDGKWQILPTEKFARQIGTRPQFATQSGPMLVIDGELHSELADDGESTNVRNAVGVDAEGRAHFVISAVPVSFGKLARYMRDELKTPNALYLDGNVSSLWDPGADRLDTIGDLGPIIIVENKEATDNQESEGSGQ